MIEKIGLQLEKVLQPIQGTRSAFFERVTGGYYLDFKVRREEAARYGLSVGEVQDVVESARSAREPDVANSVPSQSGFVEALDEPALVVESGIVRFANSAAQRRNASTTP